MGGSGLELPPVVAASPAGVRRAAEQISRGGLIGFPTETLYGLGALALYPPALERLVTLKGRSRSNPIPLLLAAPTELPSVVSRVPAAARRLMERYWPGPLTLVLPASPELPASLVGEEGGVGVRVPSDPVALALVSMVGAPITATSANLSGEPPAASAAAARLPGLDLVLDGGPRGHLPSTVVAVLDEQPRLLRQGELHIEEL